MGSMWLVNIAIELNIEMKINSVLHEGTEIILNFSTLEQGER